MSDINLDSLNEDVKALKQLSNANRQVIELLVGMVNFLRKEMEELKNGGEKELDRWCDQEAGSSQSETGSESGREDIGGEAKQSCKL